MNARANSQIRAASELRVVPFASKRRSPRPLRAGMRPCAEPVETRLLLSAITFEQAVTYPGARNPESVAIGDFNGDGTPDIAVGASGGITILTDGGAGAFYPSAPDADNGQHGGN